MSPTSLALSLFLFLSVPVPRSLAPSLSLSLKNKTKHLNVFSKPHLAMSKSQWYPNLWSILPVFLFLSCLNKGWGVERKMNTLGLPFTKTRPVEGLKCKAKYNKFLLDGPYMVELYSTGHLSKAIVFLIPVSKITYQQCVQWSHGPVSCFNSV